MFFYSKIISKLEASSPEVVNEFAKFVFYPLILILLFSFTFPGHLSAQRLWGEQGTAAKVYDPYKIVLDPLVLPNSNHSLLVENLRVYPGENYQPLIEFVFNQDGNLVDSLHYPEETLGYLDAVDWKVTEDGGRLLALKGAWFDNCLMMRLDSEGNFLWQHVARYEYGIPYNDNFFVMQSGDIDIFIYPTYNDSTSYYAATLVRDDTGEEISTLLLDDASSNRIEYSLYNDQLYIFTYLYENDLNGHQGYEYIITPEDGRMIYREIQMPESTIYGFYYFHDILFCSYLDSSNGNQVIAQYSENREINDETDMSVEHFIDLRFFPNSTFRWIYYSDDTYKIRSYILDNNEMVLQWNIDIDSMDPRMIHYLDDGSIILMDAIDDNMRMKLVDYQGNTVWNNSYDSFNYSSVLSGIPKLVDVDETVMVYPRARDSRIKFNKTNGELVSVDNAIINADVQSIYNYTLVPAYNEYQWLVWKGYDFGDISNEPKFSYAARLIGPYLDSDNQEEDFIYQGNLKDFQNYCTANDGSLWLIGEKIQKVNRNGENVFPEALPGFSEFCTGEFLHCDLTTDLETHPIVYRSTTNQAYLGTLSEDGTWVEEIMPLSPEDDALSPYYSFNYNSIQDEELLLHSWKSGRSGDRINLKVLDIAARTQEDLLTDETGLILKVWMNEENFYAVHFSEGNISLDIFNRNNNNLLYSRELVNNVDYYYSSYNYDDNDSSLYVYSKALFHDNILTLAYESSINEVWFLQNFDLEGNETSESFPTNFVYGILPAADGGIWIERNYYEIALLDDELNFLRETRWAEDDRHASPRIDNRSVAVTPYGEVTGVWDLFSTTLVVQRLEGILATGLDERVNSNLPSGFSLSQAWPNPFNSVTRANYSLPNQSHVKICIYDILGREVTRLFDGNRGAGNYNLVWHGRNSLNHPVASGTYYLKMEAGDFATTQKITLLK